MKKRILKILREGAKPTTQIASILKRNHYDTLSALIELKKEKKVKEIKKGKYIYWELKK